MFVRIACLMMLALCVVSLAACAVESEPAYARPGAVWIPGHDNGWYWVPGHWT